MIDPAAIRPECAVCCHPVERVRKWVDVMRAAYHFRFECHGATEDAFLYDTEVLAGDIAIGRCFVQAATLPAPRKALP